MSIFLKNAVSLKTLLENSHEHIKNFQRFGAGREDEEKTHKVVVQPGVQKLCTKFFGVSQYTLAKFIKIKKKLESSDKTSKIRKANSIISFLLSFVTFSFYLVFALFTVFYLLKKSPQNTTYFMMKSMQDLVKYGASNTISSKAGVVDDIIDRLTPFFLLQKNSTFLMVSPIRLAFVTKC